MKLNFTARYIQIICCAFHAKLDIGELLNFKIWLKFWVDKLNYYLRDRIEASNRLSLVKLKLLVALAVDLKCQKCVESYSAQIYRFC